VQACITTNPPSFITFLLFITDPEDIDMTLHCKNIWAVLEGFSQSNNQSLVSQFSQSYPLIEKLLVGTKRTLNSKSDISQHMRNLINNIKTQNPEIERMVKEATKRLAN